MGLNTQVANAPSVQTHLRETRPAASTERNLATEAGVAAPIYPNPQACKVYPVTQVCQLYPRTRARTTHEKEPELSPGSPAPHWAPATPFK